MNIESLQTLRTAIVNFHQNMRILYDDLHKASGASESTRIIFEKYHPLFENIKAAGVFGSTFTLQDMQEHLRYLIGIVRPLVSANALEQSGLGNVQGAENLAAFGKHVQESLVPLATALTVPADEAAMIEKAPTLSDLLNKVGANLVSYVRQYLGQLTVAERNDLLLKWATEFARWAYQQ